MIKYKLLKLTTVVVAVLMVYSCKDDFYQHYNRSGALSDKTLNQLIQENAHLSKFAQLVKVAGYDSLLTSTQTYTVWAPVDDAFAQVDPATITKTMAKQMVSNHIARFNNPTSMSPEQQIRMNSYKLYAYTQDGAEFGGSELISKDAMAKNGILHTIKTQIPYRNNVYESITSATSAGQLAAFIKKFDEIRFDETLSIPIDIDENGRTVYDSVKTSYNRLFDGNLGSINNEDSTYTMIIPSDNAWNTAYARYAPYFKTYSDVASKADSIQNTQTSLAIVNDLIYRGVVNDSNLPDSITSTSGSVIHDPASLLSGTSKQEASNGWVYFTDQLKYNDNETWNKNIEVECEDPEGRVASPNTGINTRAINAGSEITASGSRYIEVVPSTTSAQPGVTFEIPNVLSGKYDVYVEFIPGSIDGTPTDSTRLLFDLTYLTATGKTTNITVKQNSFVTSGTNKTRIKAFSSFEFPVANYYDRLWWINYKAGLYNYSDHVVTTQTPGENKCNYFGIK